MKKLHLISNAHIDPVWQWEWEEGAAEAISTFRTAANLCEQFDGFVFNHNEAKLYMWVEEYEPELFERIKKLVKEKKWNIMGGWIVQPDCNMPSGESFVRQSLYGINYFWEKFGIRPYAINNFDSFGHTQGLAQILSRAGYKYYIFCRPAQEEIELPYVFKWKGFDGSYIIASRAYAWYSTPLGKAAKSIESFIDEHKHEELAYRLWGVGDHGGGPSKQDVSALSELAKKYADNIKICHSTPDDFFGEYLKSVNEIPEIDRDINSVFVGCYTSQLLIKQLNRKLENELLSVEKMVSNAAVNALAEYPAEDIKQAWLDLLYLQFHDILAGTCTFPAEEASIRAFHRPLETLAQIKTRAFFALASGQKEAVDGEIPILIYNPHPFKTEGIYECEFSMADFNWNEGEFTDVEVYQNGVKIPSQVEKESGNLNLDWRKRVAFKAALEPSAMTRLDCRLKLLDKKPVPATDIKDGCISFENGEMSLKINAETGYIDSYKINGKELISAGFNGIAVYADTADPWKSDGCYIENYEGKFILMNEREASEFSGAPADTLMPVRVIEDGAARICVEALMKYKHSFARVLYMLPKSGTDFYADYILYFNEKDKHVRLHMPVVFNNFTAQTAYGEYMPRTDGKEQAAHKWFMGYDNDNALAVVNNGLYGISVKENIMRQSLLRTSAYAALSVGRPLVPSDRFMPRIDQGEQRFSFMFCGGDKKSVMEKIDRVSLAYNEKPMALSFFPNGNGKIINGGIIVDNVRMDVLKQAENSEEGYIIRLFNVKNSPVTGHITYKILNIDTDVNLGAFEIKTFALKKGGFTEIPLLEREYN